MQESGLTDMGLHIMIEGILLDQNALGSQAKI